MNDRGISMAEQRYRLPDVLGGGEFGGYVFCGVATFEVPGVGRLMLPEDSVVEVASPLPPEPAVGEFVACGAAGNLLPFFRRWDEGWGAVGGSDPRGWTWAEICARAQERRGGPPVRLVPDPFAEPVELPWASQPYAQGLMRTVVHLSSDGVVDENGNGITGVAVAMPPEMARAKARALLAAADRAESGQSDG